MNLTWTAYFVPTGHRRLNEFVGLLLITVAVLIALSLISFNVNDPSFNISRNPHLGAKPSNFVGVIGACTADAMLQGFGYTSFFFPIFLGVYAFYWLASWEVQNFWTRFMGMTLMIFTVSASFSMTQL